MKVLMISGDAGVLQEGTAANIRYKLQKSQVDDLVVLCRNPGESKYAAAWRMLREGSKLKWDVVTAQDPFFLGLIGQQIVQATGAKLQLQVHTDLAAQPLWKKILARVLLRQADTVRVVSTRVWKWIEPLALRARVTVLPIYVDLDAVRAALPIDTKNVFPQFDKIILVASRLEVEKNVALAIKALPLVLHSVPKAGLVIAGDGSQLESLQQLAKKLGVADKVIFVGYRGDVYSIYKSVNVLLNTSRYEGFGASVVEALAVGCPVVSTDVGIVREAGAIIANRKQEIAKKLIEVLTSGTKGQLRLVLPPAFEWAQAWKESL